jgi:hypothetical protein
MREFLVNSIGTLLLASVKILISLTMAAVPEMEGQSRPVLRMA